MGTYMALIFGDETVWEAWTEQEITDNATRHRAFAEAAGAAVVGGGELAPSAESRSVRTRGGRQQVTDGPFTEAKEVVGGYYLLEAADLDAAVELARQVPEASAPATRVEVRPVR